ncbi:MAG: TetR/AcrR family transcriptional regulator [Planctomycetota bacterium]
MPTPADTKSRILDAAEALFAEHGFPATSLRAVTAAADANLAAVHYHFGSKEALFRAVFERRLAPMNAARMARLDALEGTHPALEQILEAFLRPALELIQQPDGRRFMRLAARIDEPGEHWKPVITQFDEVRQRFLAALRRALPGLPVEALFWRTHFMIGALCHTLGDTYRLRFVSDSLCDPTDVETALHHLLPFAAAGFRAALPTTAAGPATT